MRIGDWVIRENRGVAHLVESVVSGDTVTRCGRRLADEPTQTGGPLVPFVLGSRSICRTCIGPVT